jgi:hypothetical protein
LNAQASDAAGNVGISSDVTVTVTNPPQFSSVTASNVQSTTATISWTTDKASTSQVEYGKTTAYGTTTTLDSTLVTSHAQGLSGLTANTTYHYRVHSTDGAGIAGVSGDFAFTTAGAGATTLVGDQTVEASTDNNPAGAAEAFQYTAGTSGNLDTLFVYLDSTNTATQVIVGLYANNASNSPGALLTQATIAKPVNGAWNNATVPTTPVTIGTKYWIAIMSPVGAGTVKYRDKTTGTASQASAQTNLSALPGTWSSGANFANAPMSAYAAQVNGTPPPPDTTPPTASLTAPASGATVSGNAVTVSASASDNVGVTSVQFLLDGAPLGAPVTTLPYSIAWDTTAVANGSHALSAQAKDAAGNVGTATATSVTVSNTAATPTPTPTATPTGTPTGTAAATSTPTSTPTNTPVPTNTPTATPTVVAVPTDTPSSPGQFAQGAAQFAQGSQSGVAVGADGALGLVPAFSDDFPGTSLNGGAWSTTVWSTGGTAAVANSAVSVDGVGLETKQSFTQRSFEARALFTAGPPAYQNIGWSPDLNGSQWILVGEPGADPAHVYARVATGSGSEQLVQLPATLGVYHTYRIDWGASQISFSVDGTLATTIAATLTNPMGAWLSVGPTGHALAVDWARVLQYSATSGTFTSPTLDAGSSTTWQTATTSGATPSGTTLGVQTRSSVDGVTWSAYQAVGGGGAIASPAGRYLQYQLAFAGSATASPSVDGVTVNFSG